MLDDALCTVGGSRLEAECNGMRPWRRSGKSEHSTTTNGRRSRNWQSTAMAFPALEQPPRGVYPSIVSRENDRPLTTQRPIPLTVVCWVLAVAGGALVVALAPTANIYRCADGWTNLGEKQWLHAIAALVLTAPALGRATWLVTRHKGSARLRWAAVAVAFAVPVASIALAFAFLPDAPAIGTCAD